MKYLFVVLSILVSQVSFAQCDSCNLPEDADFCYTNELFESHCAAFFEDEDAFQFTAGKKMVSIPLAEQTEIPYLLDLANDKKLKIKAQDLLFIQLALEEWSKAKMTLGYTIDENGLGIKILEEGTGTVPKNGDNIKVHYTGFLPDGKKFDSSLDRGRPIEFILGTGRVIQGWDMAFAQLKRGTKARILVPPNLGYGARGAGGVIPPNATLIFEVEVIE